VSQSKPTLSLLVPTHREDRPLRRCLDSVVEQLAAGDEVIVVGDTADGPLPSVAHLVRSYGPQFTYAALNTGQHDYGHSQLNYAMTLAQGEYLHFNDDDDVWQPNALDVFRMAIKQTPDLPLLFRFKSWVGPIFWLRPGLFERNAVGGHCLVTPNDPTKLGQWAPEYNGDWDFVEQTVNAYGGPSCAIWRDEIIAVARP
jgi:hypothetical protein